MSKLDLNLTPESTVPSRSLEEEYGFMLRFQSKAEDKSNETAGFWVQGWREGNSLALCSCFWAQKDFWGLSKVNNLLAAASIDRWSKGGVAHQKKSGALAGYIFRRNGLEVWGRRVVTHCPISPRIWREESIASLGGSPMNCDREVGEEWRTLAVCRMRLPPRHMNEWCANSADKIPESFRITGISSYNTGHTLTI